jgi:hypothetical protein
MREHEMRTRALRFLKARMRNMIMPATVGISLAVGGCSDPKSLYMGPMPNDAGHDVLVAKHDAMASPDSPSSADVLPSGDVLGPDTARDTRDAASGSDLVVDTLAAADGGGGILAGEVGADVPPELGGMKYIAPFADAAPDATALDLGGMKYVAPFVDASPADAPADTAVAKYIAPMPDAGLGDLPAMKYMAQVPNPGVVAMYMAQFSS